MQNLELRIIYLYLYAMITIKGYKEVDYDTFQGNLYDAFKRSGKTYFKIAGEIQVNSTQTPANAIKSNRQVVSDEILTSIMQSVGLKGFIIWVLGLRYYYIKTS